jgi:hypothetical protein
MYKVFSATLPNHSLELKSGRRWRTGQTGIGRSRLIAKAVDLMFISIAVGVLLS